MRDEGVETWKLKRQSGDLHRPLAGRAGTVRDFEKKSREEVGLFVPTVS